MTLHRQGGVVADAIHRKQSRIGPAGETGQLGLGILHAAVVQQQEGTRSLGDGAQLGGLAWSATDIEQRHAIQVQADPGMAGRIGREGILQGRDLRPQRVRMMALCVLTTAAYAALPPGAPSRALYGILALLGVFGIGWFPLYLLQIAEISPKSAVAATVSAATTLCMVVMSLGPLVFGLIVDPAGCRLAWAVLILPVLLLVPLLVRLPVQAVS